MKLIDYICFTVCALSLLSSIIISIIIVDNPLAVAIIICVSPFVLGICFILCIRNAECCSECLVVCEQKRELSSVTDGVVMPTVAQGAQICTVVTTADCDPVTVE